MPPQDKPDLQKLIEDLHSVHKRIRELHDQMHRIEREIFQHQLGLAYDLGKPPLVAFLPHLTKYDLN